MKNKGRTQLASNGNCKGCFTFLTRPIEQIGSRSDNQVGKSKKYMKKKWSKRVRGYFKSQTKDLLNEKEL